MEATWLVCASILDSPQIAWHWSTDPLIKAAGTSLQSARYTQWEKFNKTPKKFFFLFLERVTMRMWFSGAALWTQTNLRPFVIVRLRLRITSSRLQVLVSCIFCCQNFRGRLDGRGVRSAIFWSAMEIHPYCMEIDQYYSSQTYSYPSHSENTAMPPARNNATNIWRNHGHGNKVLWKWRRIIAKLKYSQNKHDKNTAGGLNTIYKKTL